MVIMVQIGFKLIASLMGFTVNMSIHGMQNTTLINYDKIHNLYFIFWKISN